MCLREESEPHTYDSSGILAYFNPRFREGSDNRGPAGIREEVRFQSTLPRRKRRTSRSLTMSYAYFNPRFREGSDQMIPRIPGLSRISIHASAKEATKRVRICCMTISNFNPRFREGSDTAMNAWKIWKEYFNPRFREGSDRLA